MVFYFSFRLSFKRKEGSSRKREKEQQSEAARSLFTGYNNNNLNNNNLNNTLTTALSTTPAIALTATQWATLSNGGEGSVSPLPAKFIRATRVIPRSLTPQWNEKFRLWVKLMLLCFLSFLYPTLFSHLVSIFLLYLQCYLYFCFYLIYFFLSFLWWAHTKKC